MHWFSGILNNKILWAALAAWSVAQVLKVLIDARTNHRLNVFRMVGSGGMPSSHTALVVALSISTGCLQGFDSPSFAIAAALAVIVMYDATGVRRETGNQARILNEILQTVFVDGKPISDVQLKELIGHKPTEVAAGVVVGALVAWLVLSL